MRITLLGAPGTGKGTQAAILNKRLGWPIISTGNLLRAAVEAKSELGMEVKDLIAHGELVSDQIALDLVRERLEQNDCHDGCILDGVPRTIVQADGLEEMGLHIDYCLLFDVADQVIISRLAGRHTCLACGGTYHLTNNPPREKGICDYCGAALRVRPDDQVKTITRRLEIYRERTACLIDYYDKRGLLRVIPTTDTLEETTELVLSVIGAK
ncbi:MAG: nucleoside monophosphate kinase [Oscillospiraceae bacterium]|nr:nucleoside monophosphate kinase [Oscillospiraceae bacterium]